MVRWIPDSGDVDSKKMGRSSRKSHTLPSSPTHSSSSSFEFTISELPPHKSSAADELFYKGQLLPLHLRNRLSSSDDDDTSSRDSTASLSDSSTDHHLHCESSRPSSAADDDFTKRLPTADNHILTKKPTSKYFSLSKFSSVFRKETKNSGAVKRLSSGAREVLHKYLKKVKPLYEKPSRKHQQQQQQQKMRAAPPVPGRTPGATICLNENKSGQSFSGNLRYPRRRSRISSCPSSMMSSPKHGESGFQFTQMGHPGSHNRDGSSMEELQSAIQGAIAHCKNSMMMNKKPVTNGI